jgi:hypothetical protein
MRAFVRVLLWTVATVLGLAMVAGTAVFLATVTSSNWVYWTFPAIGTPKGDITRIAWAEPISRSWADPPTDITQKVCPLVDETLRSEAMVDHEGERYIAMFIGNCLFAHERLIYIAFARSDGACMATVRVPPPSCAL